MRFLDRDEALEWVQNRMADDGFNERGWEWGGEVTQEEQ